MPVLIIAVFLFLLGLCVGSFLNVCIFRLPAEESIVWPASHCPKCSKKLAWYDNLPLLSYVVLRGRCRHCGTSISPQYFVVELLTALVMAGYYLAYFQWGVRDGALAHWPIYVVHMALACTLIVVSAIDFKLKEIYPLITNWGMGIAIVACFVFPVVQTMAPGFFEEGFWGQRFNAVLGSTIGLLAGGGITWMTRILGRWAFKREAMGFGDVLLMGMIGAVLGWEGAVLTFMIAPFFGLVYALAVLIRGKEHEVPYGPFLSIAAVVVMLIQSRAVEHFAPGFRAMWKLIGG
ncbi:MAG: prepilin peptidase [Planctomycetia bacterium]|nr:prepilin peptidase [Planctomycetia bacterium]